MPDIKNERTPTDLVVDRELIEQSKDEKEEETGIFHWRDAKGKYHPVTEMSPEEIDYAITFCDKQMIKLHETMIKLHAKMHAWQYREEKLNEERARRHDGISSRAASQVRELTE
jgi:hypothetical protein